MSRDKLRNIDDSAYETFEDWHVPHPMREKKQDFLSSRAWLDIRAKVLMRYGRQCMKCGDTQGTIQVDHIKPRFYYPELALDFNNLQVLCRVCNLKKGTWTRDYRKTKF